MAIINTNDVSINAAGDIRWTGQATDNKHSILEFIQFLMDKQDDEQASGNDLLDITVETPFNRSTDQIVTLNSPFNIDDTFAQHLYDGSLSQSPGTSGETLYSGLRLIGPVEFGTEYMIIQDGKVLPAFWGTGINAEASPSLVFSRHLVKSKVNGVKIDGQRITVLARELGDQFRRFPATLGTGNGVAAIGNGADIFNTTIDSTLAGFTDILNTEGFQQIDIDGNGIAEGDNEYYSQWVKDTRTVNQVYEYTKWITQRSHTADSFASGNPSSANDYIIDDNDVTSLGIGTEFTSTAVGEIITGAQLIIRRLTGNLEDQIGTFYAELWRSDDASPGAPTASALARSEAIIVSNATDQFEPMLFQFNRINPLDGSDQNAGRTLIASTKYFIVVRHADGTATNNFAVGGDDQSTDDGNLAIFQGASWAGTVGEALEFELYTSPEIHGLAGQNFQGINVEVAFDAETGTVAENDVVIWGTAITYDTLADGPFLVGEYVTFKTDATDIIVSGGTVLWDNASTQMIVALDTPGAGVIVNTDDISTVRGNGATETTANLTATITNEDKGGGTGVVLAKDDNGIDGEVYLQVLSGVNPVDDSIIYQEADSVSHFITATAVINTKTINPEFLGTSTGSNIIGSYGIGFDKDDVGSSDRFEDLSGTPRTPPNNVTFTVSGIIATDRVLVGPRTGTSLERNQWEVGVLLNGAAETEVTLQTGIETIPFDSDITNWPSTGTSVQNSALRILLDSGIYRNIDYSSHDTDSFTFETSLDFSTDNASQNNNVFLGFIDIEADDITESFTGIHSSGFDRNLFVRVRNGAPGAPIKTFEGVSAQFVSTNVTVAAIRTPDI